VPIGASVDFATPHLKTVLGFIGITDVTVILSDNTKAAEA
jgi:FMN-dependent NADH-azoreductase